MRGARRRAGRMLACRGTVGTASAHHRHRCSALGKSIPSERGAAWWALPRWPGGRGRSHHARPAPPRPAPHHPITSDPSRPHLPSLHPGPNLAGSPARPTAHPLTPASRQHPPHLLCCPVILSPFMAGRGPAPLPPLSPPPPPPSLGPTPPDNSKTPLPSPTRSLALLRQRT